MEHCGHFWVPHLKDTDKLENVQRPMARILRRSGNHLIEKTLEWKPRGRKICGDTGAIAKYLKVYIYGKRDKFCLFCGIPYDKLGSKDRG